MKYAFNWTEGGQFSNATKNKKIFYDNNNLYFNFFNISICFFIGFKAIGSGIEAKKRNKYNKQ